MRKIRPILVLLFIWSIATDGWAENRIALVIGNSDYRQIAPLVNPRNDAALMAMTLRQVGFEVVARENTNTRSLARAVRDFGRKLRAAGPDAVGLFYYAGHGVQAKGGNYLIPLDAEIETEADLEIEAVSASDVLSQMEDAGNALNIVIIDACRDNPFKSRLRSAARGLVRMNAPSGSLLAFAAAPGKAAYDGDGANSPYTGSLAQAIKEPGLTIEQVFKQARVSVENATGGQQTPWEESSLRGDFYFIPPTEASASTSGTDSQAGTATAPQGLPSVDKEALLWQAIKDSKDPDDYRAYLQSFPEGVFAPLARVRRDNLEEDVAILQPAPEKPELTISRFDGKWSLAANLHSSSRKSKCGFARMNMGIRDGQVRGKLRLVAASYADSAAGDYPFSGFLDREGNVQAKGTGLSITGVISEENLTIKGSWDAFGPSCKGTFAGRKASIP